MSATDDERLAIAHAHSLAAIDANAVGTALGVWCGNGDWAKWSQEFRDKAGVRALAELDATIVHLTAVREQLAKAVGHITDDSATTAPEGTCPHGNPLDDENPCDQCLDSYVGIDDQHEE